MEEKKNISDIVLVALDGSAPSQAAARIGIQVAKSLNLKIRGIFIVDESLVLDGYVNYQLELGKSEVPTSQAELVDWFEQKGNLELQWLQGLCQAAGVPVGTELLFGGIPEAILNETERAEMIALGRRGNQHPDDPEHLGRNFKVIAHHTHCPLLIGGEEQRKVGRMLLAYDGSSHAKNALNWAARLQGVLAQETIVLAVDEGTGPLSQWITGIDDDLKLSALDNYRLEGRAGNPEEEIISVAQTNQVDLILMGEYSHAAILEWLVGSKLDFVLHNTGIPVLVD